MAQNKKSTIVFDWNGCLLDDFIVAFTAINEIRKANDLAAVDEEEYRNRFTMPFTALYKAFDFDTMPENGQAIYGATVKRMAPEVKLRDGADLLLVNTHEQGVTNIIVSNSPCGVIMDKLKENGLDVFFAEVIGNDHPVYAGGKTKAENAGIYLNVNPADKVVFIGDTFEEIDMARRFRGLSVAITGGYISEDRLRDKNPDYVVDDLSEFTQVLHHHGILHKRLA